ncbi:MAG: hypothetical protein AB7V58_13880 [Solirubrobacterales bacterium]
MIRRNYVVALAVMCALAAGALAAANASAEQRAYTCSTGAVAEEFTDEHCLNKTGSGEYGHTLISEEEAEFTLSNAKTAESTTAAAVSKLASTVSGVVTEVQCTSLSGEGQLTNAESSVTGTGVIEYTGCTVTKPSGKGCVVKGGEITTNEVKGTTAGQAEAKIKFTPNSGETFASITIEGCSIGSLNNTFPLAGSLIADVNGATITSTHAGITSQNTLKFGGTKAGIEGAMTISAGATEIIEIDEGVALTSNTAEQRAYTCSKSASSKDFSDAHCASASESGEYGHTLISGENVKATVTNEKTASETKAAETSKLKGQLSGIATEVQCTGAHGTGTLTNSATSVTGSGTIKYTGCTVTAPASKGCKVEKGEFSTETLSATTAEQATGTLKLSPKSPATRFALVPIEGCEEGLPADAFYPVTGSLVAEVSGATVKATHAGTTEQGSLKFGGVKTGLESALTMSKEGGDPIALTVASEQTAYACSESAASKTFSDAHCLSKEGSAYGHTKITKENETITGKAVETWKLKGQLTGVVTEVQCKGASGTGTLTNATESVSGEGSIEFTECTVTAPSGKGCKVKGGTVKTETLSATTVGQAAYTLKLSPKSAETDLAHVTIEGCEGGFPADANYPVAGSLLADVNGATVETTHANTTGPETLKFGGVAAGIEGASTITRKTTKEVSAGGAVTFT